MPNAITDPPNEDYDFGYEFDYSTWTADTDILLCNVPWDAAYKDTVHFENTDELNKYLDDSPRRRTRLRGTYARVDAPISIDIPFAAATRYNYVRVYNPAQPSVISQDVPKYYYYFILATQHVNTNHTRIIVQLDVWQTYVRQAVLGRCYLERGHLGIANKNNFQNYGRDYLTVPEGLDTGSEYVIVDRVTKPVMSLTNSSNEVGHAILIATTLDLSAPPGDKKAPNINTAKGGQFQGLPSGASYYIFTSQQDFMNFMNTYSKYPWVTRSIISITVIPSFLRYYTPGHLGVKLPFGGYKAPSSTVGNQQRIYKTNWRNDTKLLNAIPPRLRHLKKFWTFPYMAMRISSNTGQQVILRPENWKDANGYYRELVSLLPPNQRVAVAPMYYNSTGAPENTTSVQGDGMDRMVSIGNFPTLALVNDEAILFMAQNANTLAFGQSSAEWSQSKALRGNQTAYDNASKGIAAGGALTENALSAQRQALGIGNDLSTSQAILNSIGGTGTGAALGLIGGGAGAAVGAAAGLAGGIASNLGTMFQQDANNKQYNASASGARGANDINAGLSSSIRDSNKSLGDWAARGDYMNDIMGQKARVQDAQLTPPSSAGQVGGEAMNLLMNQAEFRFEVLMPDQATIQAIGDVWLRYGYAVERYVQVPPTLQAMTHFTYWKMHETYLRSGDMPEGYKNTLRGILEKGVTVWAKPEYIGVIDPAINRPLDDIYIDGYVPPEVDPEPEPEPPVDPTKRKRKSMALVYATVDTNPATPGNVWGMGGDSAGTPANWQETRDLTRATAWLKALDQDEPIGMGDAEFFALKGDYLSPLSTAEIPGETP